MDPLPELRRVVEVGAAADGAGALPVIVGQTNLGSSNYEDLDAAGKTLLAAVDSCRGRTLLVDLRAEVVGAAWIGMLARAAARLRADGGRLRMTGAAPQVREVLRVCGYEDWFL